MLCDHCIKQLAARLDRPCGLILIALQKEDLNREQLKTKTELSYSSAQSALRRLEGAGLIDGTAVGRSRVYSLSSAGRRFFALYREQKGGSRIC